MKRIFLIIFIILLVGCSEETIQEPLQQLENTNEDELENDFKNAYSIKKVRVNPLNILAKGKSIDQLLEENSYMIKEYGGINELHNEQQLVELIEQKILGKAPVVGVKYLGQEMPAKLIEDTYERVTNENDLINTTFEWFEYGIEEITDGFFIDFRNHFLLNNKSREAKANREIDEMYASLAPQLEGLSDYEKIKRIYEFVMDHMDYKVAVAFGGLYDANTVVGFINGEGVCQAYAIGLYMLLDKAGFEARYVDGPLYQAYQNGFGGHAWNMVKLDEQWYHLDATWDDDQEDWLYFLVSDRRVEASRSWNKEYYEEAKKQYTGS
jgi:hypothetical protein